MDRDWRKELEDFRESEAYRRIKIALGVGLAAVVLGICYGKSYTHTHSDMSPYTLPEFTPSPTSAYSPGCYSLESFRATLNQAPGNVGVVNSGECASIFDPHTSKVIGLLAGGGLFAIRCYDVGGDSVQIDYEGIEGYVTLTDAAKQQLSKDISTNIPNC